MKTLEKGFLNARIDGEIREITYNLRLDRYKTHFVELVVDKLIIKNQDRNRLKKTIDLAMSLGKNIIMVLEKDSDKPVF